MLSNIVLLLSNHQPGDLSILWASLCLLLAYTCVALQSKSPNPRIIAHHTKEVLQRLQRLGTAVRATREWYMTPGEQPLTLRFPDNCVHVVKSAQHCEEINSAPGDVLSLYAFAQDAIQTKYVLAGYELPDTKKGADLTFIASIKSLSHQLPAFIPLFQSIVQQQCAEVFGQAKETSDWTAIQPWSFNQTLWVRLHTAAMFGEDLAGNKHWVQTTLTYLRRSLAMAGIIREVPKFFRPFVAKAALGQQAACRTVVRYIISEIQKHLQFRGATNPTGTEQLPTLVRLIAKNCPKDWTDERFMHEMITIFYGIWSNVMLMATPAIQDIARYGEYTEALRQELEDFPDVKSMAEGIESLPLLDSFLKESLRVNHSDALNYRRKALQDFELSGGHRVRAGEIVGIAAQEMARDPRHYTDPLRFNGFRFARDATRSLAAKRLTTWQPEWPFWGSPKQICPGRFYFSFVVKLVMAHLLLNYDLKLHDGKPPSSFSWRLNTVPLPTNEILIRSRQYGSDD